MRYNRPNEYYYSYNSDVNTLDIDICIQLDNDNYGLDFIFIDYNIVAISSI